MMTGSPKSTDMDDTYGRYFLTGSTTPATTVSVGSGAAALTGEGGEIVPAYASLHTGHDRIDLDMASAKSQAFGEPAVWDLVTAFEDGDKASDFWNGDVAAAEGHLGLMHAKHVQGCPLSYTHLAVSRAAKNGRLDVVAWLHNYTDVPQVPSAMDSAAAGGHLEVGSLKRDCFVSRYTHAYVRMLRFFYFSMKNSSIIYVPSTPGAFV